MQVQVFRRLFKSTDRFTSQSWAAKVGVNIYIRGDQDGCVAALLVTLVLLYIYFL
jgi:hypothetical protein